MKTISKTRVDSIDDIEFELTTDIADITKPISKKSRHYINGKDLYDEFVKYHEYKKQCLAEGKDIPPLTNKIGEAIIQIATRRCNSWRFVGYSDSWKEEMISNAIMLATIHGHNFDPNKSSNAFAYLTTICNNAIIEQIKREKKELYIRYKQYENMGGFQADIDDGDENFDDYDADSMSGGQENIDLAYEDRLQYIADYEDRMFNKPKATPKRPDIIELDV